MPRINLFKIPSLPSLLLLMSCSTAQPPLPYPNTYFFSFPNNANNIYDQVMMASVGKSLFNIEAEAEVLISNKFPRGSDVSDFINYHDSINNYKKGNYKNCIHNSYMKFYFCGYSHSIGDFFLCSGDYYMKPDCNITNDFDSVAFYCDDGEVRRVYLVKVRFIPYGTWLKEGRTRFWYKEIRREDYDVHCN